jgi:hypothetical protein
MELDLDSLPKTLKAALEAIRDMAMTALNEIEQSQEEWSMRWKMQRVPVCKAFYEACSFGNPGRCPRCRSTEFRPVL